MKKLKTVAKAASKITGGKKKVVALGLFFTVFAVSAGSAYAFVPQTVIKEYENHGGEEIVQEHTMTTKERFIANMANGASAGMNITANKFLFEYDGKNGHTNTIDAAGTEINLALSSLSLHGINLSLTAPVTYSDATQRAHQRGVHASMINSNLYLNLFDQEQENDANVMNKNWDLRYHVDLSPYDLKDEKGELIKDELTGGILQFEYGQLDWLLEDVLSILSEGGINVSLEGWLDSIMNKKEAPKTQESNTEEPSEETTTSGGISMDDIMNSMDEIVEVKEQRYFIWNLPLGSKTLSLGLRGDEDYNLAGVDLPAKYEYTVVENEEDEEKKYNIVEATSDAWEIQEGLRLSVSADVQDFALAHDEWNKTLVPNNADSYRELVNSKALIENVASYVANPQFGLDVNLDLGYETAAKAGDRTHVKKDAKADSMRIALSADADLANRKFNAAKGQISVQKVDENENIAARHDINVAYFYDHDKANGDGYLDINNDLFKAHTDWVYLDEFFGDLTSSFTNEAGTTEEKSESENTLNQVNKVMKSLGMSLDSILDSEFITDVKNGVYVSALDFIKSLRNEDNKILVDLTLAPIGLSGDITVTIDGTSKGSLLGIDLKDIKFASFTLNGKVGTRDYEKIKRPLPEKLEVGDSEDNYQDYSDYDSLSHLKGIGEQVTDIVNNKSFTANLGVTLGNEEQDDLRVDGNLAFAFDEKLKAGKVDVRMNQALTDLIVPNHRIAIDMTDGYNAVALAYESSADDDLDAVTEEALTAKLGFNSFVEEGESLLDKGLGLFNAFDDRFNRLSASLAKTTGTSLLSRISKGEYSALLEKTDIISRADLHDENGNTLLVINGAALGMENDINVAVNYDPNLINDDSTVEEGGLKSIEIGLKIGEKDLNVAIKDIASIALKDETTVQENEPAELIEGIENNFRNFESTEDFKDIGFVADLADYLVGTLTLGTTAAQDEDGNYTVSGVSYYGIEGKLGVSIGAHDINLSLFDAYASVEGAETKIYANLEGIPVIRGVNGPDNNTYFRPHEAEGVRDSAIYCYANGIDPQGQVLLTRDSSYGRVRNVRDGVRLTGEQFNSDMLGWLGKYSLGILDTLLEKEESTVPQGPAAPGKHMRAGLVTGGAIEIEKVFNGLSHKTVGDVDQYIISVDLGGMLGIPVLGDANITLSGRTVTNGSNTFKTLTGINIHADGSAKGSQGSSLSLAKVDVDLFLNNITDAGVMENVWEKGGNIAFANNFVKEVADSGEITVKGILYDLEDDAWNNLEGKPTDMYGYNFVTRGSAKSGNLYR